MVYYKYPLNGFGLFIQKSHKLTCFDIFRPKARLLWLSKYVPDLITIQTRFSNKEISCSSATLQSLPFYVSGNKVGFFHYWVYIQLLSKRWWWYYWYYLKYSQMMASQNTPYLRGGVKGIGWVSPIQKDGRSESKTAGWARRTQPPARRDPAPPHSRQGTVFPAGSMRPKHSPAETFTGLTFIMVWVKWNTEQGNPTVKTIITWSIPGPN